MGGTIWGIIGFGEAGSTFAAHLATRDGIHLVVTDPVLTRMSAQERRAKLNDTHAEIVDDIPALVSRADLCLSLVTPRAAMDAARTAASAWRDGLYRSQFHLTGRETADGCIVP